MALADLLGLDLLYIILLVIPGILGIKLYLWLTSSVENFSRLDWIVYSILLSLTSILLHFYISWEYLDQPIGLKELEHISAPLAIHGYFSLISLCILISGTFALIRHYVWDNPEFTQIADFHSQLLERKYVSTLNESLLQFDRKDTTTRREVWDDIFDNLFSAVEVQVITVNGGVIEGEVLMWGNSAQSRDVLLLNREEEVRTSNGQHESISGDNYTYIHEQDVSYITFKNIEDLDGLRQQAGLDHEIDTDAEEATKADEVTEFDREMLEPLIDLGYLEEQQVSGASDVSEILDQVDSGSDDSRNNN